MKAIIPCAGRGTRLRPITFTSAKPVVPIGNKPLVLYAVEKLKKIGITEIGIVISPETQDLKEVLKDGSQYGVHITYILQEVPKGISHTILVSREFLKDDSFVMYLGDNILQEGLEEAARKFHENQLNGLFFVSLTDKPHLYGVVIIENGKVKRIIEKPREPISNLAVIGIYFFDQTIHPIVENLKPSPRGELEITDALQGLIDTGANVEPHKIGGWWMDAGNPDDMLEANRLVLEHLLEAKQEGEVDEKTLMHGTVSIGKGTKIINSNIRGPVIIGENCEIRNAFIGSHTSIGDNCILEDCEVDFSVLMSDCVVRDVSDRIGNSIFGSKVTVTSYRDRPKCYKLILADESAVDLI
ncbi:MAG: glucose-1-phosphate thymidylyltransferase [bacterium]